MMQSEDARDLAVQAAQAAAKLGKGGDTAAAQAMATLSLAWSAIAEQLRERR